MAKFIIVALALVGACLLLTTFVPTVWFTGLTIKGHLFPIAIFILGVVGYFGYKLKS